METKKLLIVVAIGLVIGLVIGYPLARLTQPVKTTTVTKQVKVIQKLENGITANQLAAMLGTAIGVSQRPTAANNYIECIDFRGPAADEMTNTLKPGDWLVKACLKVQ
jgi:hypothetical protein